MSDPPSRAERKPRVVFVAGLTPMPTGGHGGQLTAATSILRSPLADRVELIPLSSTMESVPPPPLPSRARAAAGRMGTFARALPGADAALVFSSDGLSMLEKGAMCLAARVARRGVVVRFSSGNLPASCEESPAMKRWLRLVLRSAHVVVSQGPTWTRYFGSFAEAAGKVTEIPNGIALGEPGAPEPGDPRVVFVGWMHREKGIFELLEAAPLIRARCARARFQFIGGGRDLEAFRAEVARRGLGGYVEAAGWVDHASTLARVRGAHVFVLPTHYEGLPNAMLEAMAAGVPVVTTPVGSIPDVVRSEDNGLLVAPRDVPALVDAVARLFEQPEWARAIGAKGRATVAATYDIDKVWRRYAEALARACREAGRAPAISLASAP